MKATTKVALFLGGIYLCLGVLVVGSHFLAVRQNQELGISANTPTVAFAKASGDQVAPAKQSEIDVARGGKTTVEFANPKAVADELTSVQRELAGLRAALAKDLASGDFRARSTKVETAARTGRGARSAASGAAASRRELNALKSALKRDLGHGDFRARRTRRLVAKIGKDPALVGNKQTLAASAVSVSDDLWNLEMAIEHDIHSGDFKADETHMAIDGRRWRTN